MGFEPVTFRLSVTKLNHWANRAMVFTVINTDIYVKVIRCLIFVLLVYTTSYGQFFDKAVSFVQTPRLFLDCMYVRIAFPLFLPLPLTVSNPTATTGSLGYLYSMGVNDSIDLTNYTSMVLFKVYNVRVEMGWVVAQLLLKETRGGGDRKQVAKVGH